MRFILASASPRRLALLRQIGIEPIVLKSPYEEKTSLEGAAATVLTNAIGKGECVMRVVGDDAVVISADTVVAIDGKILGKPQSVESALFMLRTLAGRIHSVYTGIAVFYQGKREEAVVESKVKFRNLTEEEIVAYVASGEPLDKAGAYGIQGLGALLIDSIEGDYYNIVGLPLARLYELFSKMGVTQDGKILHQSSTVRRAATGEASTVRAAGTERV